MTRSLASQNARLLVGVFLIFELLVASAVVVFLMLPMARSSAADLASLMLLSAQTWSELPPETRPAFEHELAATHQLALRAEPPAYDRDEWHGPYLHFVEASLAARTGRLRHLAREEIDRQQVVLQKKLAVLNLSEPEVSHGKHAFMFS